MCCLLQREHSFVYVTLHLPTALNPKCAIPECACQRLDGTAQQIHAIAGTAPSRAQFSASGLCGLHPRCVIILACSGACKPIHRVHGLPANALYNCQPCTETRTAGRALASLKYARHRPTAHRGMRTGWCCVLACVRWGGYDSVRARPWTLTFPVYSAS